MNTLEIYTKKYGAVELRGDELALLTDAHLKMLGMSRKELHRCFAEGMRLMKVRNVKPGDRIRPCADFAGRWEVDLVHRSVIR
jgi:hypothetical protein